MTPCATCIHSHPVPYERVRISCSHPALARHSGTDPESVTLTTTDGAYWSFVNFRPEQVAACTGQREMGNGKEQAA